MGIKLVNVTADTPELFPLLERAYNDIFIHEFPDTEKEDDLGKIMQILHGGVDNMAAVVNLFVDEDSPDLRPAGIAVAYYFRREAVGLLIYNAVDPGYRSYGLGKLFVQSRIQSLSDMADADRKTLRAVFIDAKNPARVNAAEERMDPMLRLSIFKKWGASVIPIDYYLPPQTKGGKHDDTTLLLSYAVKGRTAGPAEVADFIKAFYHAQTADNGTDMNRDEKLAAMLAQLKIWEKDLRSQGPALQGPGGAPAGKPVLRAPNFA